jgi:hypothetical protein
MTTQEAKVLSDITSHSVIWSEGLGAASPLSHEVGAQVKRHKIHGSGPSLFNGKAQEIRQKMCGL